MTDELADTFARDRAYVVDVAFRMLGNIHDAEDVVQEAFGRLLRVDRDEIDDIRGWLVVVVSRICLDQLRSARHRHESPSVVEESIAPLAEDPADRVTLDDSIRMALLVVLQQLSPAERAVFVLHDVFAFSFEAVGEIVGRTPVACRQLASRARRHVEAETAPARFAVDAADEHLVAQRFIEACAGGDLDALLQLLDADVGGDVDFGPGDLQRPTEFRGAAVIGPRLLALYGPRSRITLVSQPINGRPGVLAFRDQKLFGLMQFEISDGVVVEIHAVADPDKLALLGVAFQS